MRKQTPQRARIEALSARRQEDCGLALPRERRPRLAQVARDPVGRFLAERDDPFLAALAVHVNRLLVEVDVAEVEVDQLPAAEARRVEELRERAVSDLERGLAVQRRERLLDLALLRSVREPARPLRRERELGYAARAQRHPE